jgi:hypothetical protein
MISVMVLQNLARCAYLGEHIYDLPRMLKSISSLLFQAFRCVYPDWQSFPIVPSLRLCFDVPKVTKCPCVKVRAHDRAFLKLDDFPLVVFRACGARRSCRLLLGCVAEGYLIVGNLDGELERSFHCRLIEARKCATGIARLELGGEHVVMLSVGVTRD